MDVLPTLSVEVSHLQVIYAGLKSRMRLTDFIRAAILSQLDKLEAGLQSAGQSICICSTQQYHISGRAPEHTFFSSFWSFLFKPRVSWYRARSRLNSEPFRKFGGGWCLVRATPSQNTADNIYRIGSYFTERDIWTRINNFQAKLSMLH
jgi:hypothetical protein